MSKYNHYAKDLESAFMEAREKYMKAYNCLDDAQKRFDFASRSYVETFRGERDVKIAEATARLKRAKADFNQESESAWREFFATREKLKNALQAEIQRDSIVNPEAVDNSTVELLKSGICSPEDMESLAERYDGNATMLRLISKYSFDGAKNTIGDDHEKARFNIVAERTRKGLSKAMNEWENLSSISDTLSGQSHGKGSPDYTAKISERWEELASQVVENF